MKTTYQNKKAQACEIAIEWQANSGEKDYSYLELSEIGDCFYKLGKRFGLLREFRENCISC